MVIPFHTNGMQIRRSAFKQCNKQQKQRRPNKENITDMKVIREFPTLRDKKLLPTAAL